MDFDDFGEPIPVRDSRLTKILDKIPRYAKILITSIFVIAALVTILTAFGFFEPPQTIPIEENFDTRIIGDFTERMFLDLTDFFTPYKVDATLSVEGVVPNPGWVKITIENFTHYSTYKQEALQIREVETWDDIEFSVDRGNFQKEIDLSLRFQWFKTVNYPFDSNSEIHGPIGNIFFKAEYYDSTKQSSEIFYLTPYVTGSYFAP